MAINLTKGGNVNLTKEAPGLSKIMLGLGWVERKTVGVDFDLDVSAIMLTESGRARSDDDMIFYLQPVSKCGSVTYGGDNKKGADAAGVDAETMSVDLREVPQEIKKIVFTVTIYGWRKRRQNFGMVSDAYIRLVDESSGKEVARYDLTEDASTETAMIFAELYRNGSDWKFKAVGQGYVNGLAEMARNFGIDASEEEVDD